MAGFLRLDGKNWNGDIEVLFTYHTGINGFAAKDLVKVAINEGNGKLKFKNYLKKGLTAEIDLNRVTDVRAADVNMAEENNPLAAAFLMSFFNKNLATAAALNAKGTKTNVRRHLIIIRYQNKEGVAKTIYLERNVGGSCGWKKFVAALPKDLESPTIKMDCRNKKNIEL